MIPIYMSYPPSSECTQETKHLIFDNITLSDPSSGIFTEGNVYRTFYNLVS